LSSSAWPGASPSSRRSRCPKRTGRTPSPSLSSWESASSGGSWYCAAGSLRAPRGPPRRRKAETPVPQVPASRAYWVAVELLAARSAKRLASVANPAVPA
jgi:hypothetical protein